jgi:hypothetical protein
LSSTDGPDKDGGMQAYDGIEHMPSDEILGRTTLLASCSLATDYVIAGESLALPVP